MVASVLLVIDGRQAISMYVAAGVLPVSQWPECQQYSVAGVLLVIDGWEAISMYVAVGVLPVSQWPESQQYVHSSWSAASELMA